MPDAERQPVFPHQFFGDLDCSLQEAIFAVNFQTKQGDQSDYRHMFAVQEPKSAGTRHLVLRREAVVRCQPILSAQPFVVDGTRPTRN